MIQVNRATGYNIIEWALVALVVGVTLFTVTALADQVRDARRVQALIGDATGRNNGDSSEAAGSSERGRHARLARSVNERHLFAPSPPEVRLTGIFDGEAMFSNDESGEAGDRVGDMKVVEIGPGWVEVEVDGESRKMWVFGENSGFGDSSRSRRSSRRGPPDAERSDDAEPDADDPSQDAEEGEREGQRRGFPPGGARFRGGGFRGGPPGAERPDSSQEAEEGEGRRRGTPPDGARGRGERFRRGGGGDRDLQRFRSR